MAIDSTKAAAAVSLLALIGLSLVLYSGSQDTRVNRATDPTGDPGGATALPPDHPEVDLASAPLFDARFESLEARLSADSSDAGAILEMGQLLQDAHRPVEAAEFYERFLTVHPDSGAVWLYLANAYGTANEWPKSAEATARMLERLPNHAGGMYNMGAALANQGRYADAREWWEQARLAGDPLIAGRAEESLGKLPSS